MFLTIQELSSHLRIENVYAIIRNDETIALAAIDGAIAEAKGYLTRYDVDALFGATGDNRHKLLLIFVKDIAAWHLINIVNPNIDLKLRKERYERAIAWLKDVQAGIVQPDFPVVAESTDNDIIRYGSNDKNTYEW